MRLFVALEISQEIRAEIAELIHELKTLDDSWKWTPANNLHVTLKFLGETPAEKLPSIAEALRNISTGFPISLKFRSLGFFPSERHPRVLWAGMERAASLSNLARAIDDVLGKISVAREEREFTPHLTLARSKDGRISSKLREAVAKSSNRVFGTMTTSAFHLMEIKLKSMGAEYTSLQSFPGASHN